MNAIPVFDTVLERQARQIAIELVGPLVIGADKAAGIAVRLLAKAHAAVGAAVFHNAYTGICGAVLRGHPVPDHQHLALTHVAEFVVADIGNLSLEADVTPVRAVKDFSQFLLVELRVGVGPRARDWSRLAPAGKITGKQAPCAWISTRPTK